MKTIAKPFQKELNIKKSQFICRIFPIENSFEAKEIIQEITKENYDATHNCSAYIAIDGEGYDDDGEPSGTAGKPMLNALKKNNIENIVAIVTRYFGGIKLGSGGLVRAYSKSVLETITIAKIVEMKLYNIFKITFDYSSMKNIDNNIRSYKITVLNKDFNEKISYEIATEDVEKINSFRKKFSLRMKISYLGEKYLHIT